MTSVASQDKKFKKSDIAVSSIHTPYTTRSITAGSEILSLTNPKEEVYQLMGLFDRFKKKSEPETAAAEAPLIDNTILLERWDKYRQTGTQQALSDFYEEFCLRAKFLLLTTMPLPEGADAKSHTMTLTENTPIDFALIKSDGGEAFFPLFTSWEQIAKWSSAPSNQALILSFDDLAAMVTGAENVNGVSIDPFDQNILIPRHAMLKLKEQKDINQTGHTQINVQAQTKVQLSEPGAAADELKAALVSFFAADTSIKKAWLQLMKKEEETTYLLVVDFDGDREKVFPAIAEAARPQLQGMYLDMVPYGPGFPESAVAEKKAFYPA